MCSLQEKEDYKRASIVKGAILDSESRRRNMARVFSECPDDEGDVHDGKLLLVFPLSV